MEQISSLYIRLYSEKDVLNEDHYTPISEIVLRIVSPEIWMA